MAASSEAGQTGFEACFGCGICVLVCPVWRQRRDVWFTPHGRAKATQGGATAEALADSLSSCIMCGACEPVCPAEIDVLGRVRGLRSELVDWQAEVQAIAPTPAPATAAGSANGHGRVLLAGPILSSMPDLLETVVDRLGGPRRVAVHSDDGRDLAWALEAGAIVDPERVERFAAPLRAAGELVVVEGILHSSLRSWCPGVKVRGVAESLVTEHRTRAALGPGDMLVVDARCYNADFTRLVDVFESLRRETGCQINLDLQKVALPTGSDSLQHRLGDDEGCSAAIGWILYARDIDRIVVETPADLEAFARRTSIPVIHLATLAGSGA